MIKFLEEIISYCSEYYSELRIKLIIEDASYRQFSIKHAAITEAIFTIFTSIIRIGEFDEEVILKGYFSNNTSPTISIEASLQDSLLRPLGWKLGPNYIHSGLLSIYLLAKENNFFFHIEQKDNKIIFLLEPIDNERLKSANALCRKLPLNITS